MTNDRYKAAARIIKDYKNRVENLIIKFKNLKGKWSARSYNEPEH
jgi:hypothetical protein